MDPLDHLRALPDGVRCTVCEDPVPTERITVLACRDDLAFLQVDCASCRSTTLGFATAGVVDGPRALGERASSLRAAVTSDDVLDMHQLLATWTGDLASLLSVDPIT